MDNGDSRQEALPQETNWEALGSRILELIDEDSLESKLEAFDLACELFQHAPDKTPSRMKLEYAMDELKEVIKRWPYSSANIGKMEQCAQHLRDHAEKHVLSADAVRLDSATLMKMDFSLEEIGAIHDAGGDLARAKMQEMLNFTEGSLAKALAKSDNPDKLRKAAALYEELEKKDYDFGNKLQYQVAGNAVKKKLEEAEGREMQK